MTRKKAAQLDREIAHALSKNPRKPPSTVLAVFENMVDNATSYGAENLSLAKSDEGYTGDPKEFRFSAIFARRLPTYKYELLVDYISEAAEQPHKRLGRKLTQKEAAWMLREAGRIRDDEQRYLREDLSP